MVADFFGTTRVHVLMDSKAFTDGVYQHTFEDTRDRADEVFWARIYAGSHYRYTVQANTSIFIFL